MNATRLLRLLALGLVLAGCETEQTTDGSDPLPNPTTGSGEGGDGQGGTGEGGAGGGGLGGVGGQGACDGTGAVVAEGAEDRILLRGTILAPTGPLEGEVLVEGNTITCVAESCAAEAGANGATILETDGVISAGLIDTHNHILFDIFDEDDWVPEQIYLNHNQWPNEDRYGAMVDMKQHLNGEGYTGQACVCGDGACKSGGTPACGENETNCPEDCVDHGCELLKYGEVKALVAGTTSVQGSPGGANRTCFGSIARTIDTGQNDLADDKIQTATIFPSTSSADGVCTNFGDGDTDAYVIHIGEGVDQTSRDEFDDLGTVTTTDGCLFEDKTTIIHGTALTEAQFDTMASNGMSLVWSPKSNVFLYGGGTDFTKTTNIPYVLSQGINVAVAPDWSLGGSQNMLDELRFANQVDDQEFGDILTPRELHDMATFNAARALGLDNVIGSIAVGARADITIFLPQGADPYAAVLGASPREVVLVMVDGRVLYGDAALETVLAPSNSVCEDFTACCRPKFLCIGETDGAPADRLDQTLEQIATVLNTASENYDQLDVSEWNFAPITPIVKCE